MDSITYQVLFSILAKVGLTKNGSPDFDKIASITGHSRDSVKVLLAPKADTPRWIKLLNYVGEELHTQQPQPIGGIALILKERVEQLEKHNRPIEWDVENNQDYQLATGALRLLSVLPSETDMAPMGWDQKIWQHMKNKPYHDRLILAGALIAAELDRLVATAPTKENTEVTC